MAKFKLQYSLEFYANLWQSQKKKKQQQNKTKKKKNDFSMHFAFTGYGKNGDPNISQAYRR